MPPRGSYSKGLVTRDAILDAALQLFAQGGYDRTSVREIARQAGLSQAGLLHHFTSKEQLFLELLRRRDQVNERDHTDSHGRPVTVAGLIQIVAHNALEPDYVRLFVTMMAEGSKGAGVSRDFFDARYRSLLSDLTDDVEAYQSKGIVDPRFDAESIARLLVAAADGLQVQWLIDPSAVDMAGELADLWSSFHV